MYLYVLVCSDCGKREAHGVKPEKAAPVTRGTLYGHTYSKNMDQPGKVANPAWSAEQGKLIFPCPRSPLKIWSSETGSAVASRVSLLISIPEAKSGAYLRDSSRVPRRRPFIYEEYCPPFARVLATVNAFFFFFFFFFFHLTYSRWTSSLPSCLWSQRIFPSLPGSRLTNILSRCKFSTLTTRQPMVEFYLLTFPRFPIRKKEHKSYLGKNRTHDFRTSRCAAYLLDHSGAERHICSERAFAQPGKLETDGGIYREHVRTGRSESMYAPDCSVKDVR